MAPKDNSRTQDVSPVPANLSPQYLLKPINRLRVSMFSSVKTELITQTSPRLGVKRNRICP